MTLHELKQLREKASFDTLRTVPSASGSLTHLENTDEGERDLGDLVATDLWPQDATYLKALHDALPQIASALEDALSLLSSISPAVPSLEFLRIRKQLLLLCGVRVVTLLRKVDELKPGQWWIWEATREDKEGNITRGFVQSDGHMIAEETWEDEE
jgi:hypothetical protein